MSKKTKQNTDLSLAEQALLQRQVHDASVADSLKGSEAGAIWSEIKDLNIEMFALPHQKVGMHCHPVTIEPTKLYLVTNSSAVLPSLEVAIGEEYKVEQVDKFVIVSRTPVSLLKK